MMLFGPAAIALIVIGLPTIVIGYLLHRWMQLKEKKLEVDGRLAVEKAAQYAASNAELEARVRILEQIVTDAGAQTANQIEALRDKPERAQLAKQLERDRSN